MDHTITVESLGYAIEHHDDDDGQGDSFAYTLRGPRGAVYGLIRTIPTPWLMYAVNTRRRGKVTKVQGWSWFRDDGEYPLRPVG